jgi:uncharacterized membrane protein YphA (DoxX/SURF4 family)
LAGRLILAASLLPDAIVRATNVSGFGLQLWMKGMPYPTAVASGVVVAELIGPMALVLGLAPRLTATVLIATTVITTGILHRFWDLAGAARQAMQASSLGCSSMLSLGRELGALRLCGAEAQPSPSQQPRGSRAPGPQPLAR